MTIHDKPLPAKLASQLDTARTNGFLTYRTGQSKAFAEWYAICKAERRPFVFVRTMTKYAYVCVSVETIPTSAGDLAPIALTAIRALFDEYQDGTPRCSVSPGRCHSASILIADAPWIASRLVELAQYREVAK